MRTPGGPVARDDILPTSIEVRHKDSHLGFARIHDLLQELADFLGPQRSREALPYRDELPDGNSDRAAAQAKLGIACPQRPTGDRSENWELAIAAFEDVPSVWARERNHEVVPPKSSDVRDDDKRQGFAGLRDSVQELTELLEPQRNRESGLRREKAPEEDPDWAAARTQLGLAYAQRDDGDRSQNWAIRNSGLPLA
jgi:hypothetical protein